MFWDYWQTGYIQDLMKQASDYTLADLTDIDRKDACYYKIRTGQERDWLVWQKHLHGQES